MATLSQFLISEIKRSGINEVFGIPGDFILDLFHRVEESEKFRIVKLSHEPGLGFAAQAAAKATQGIGLCCVTYGVGALNTINPIACAYAEKVPLVLISGGPGKKEISSEMLVHHQVKDFASQRRIFEEITGVAYILNDPKEAAGQIRKAFSYAKTFLRPVYLEVPRDLVDTKITIPDDLNLEYFPSDTHAATEVAKEIERKIASSKRPTLMIGVEVERYGLTQKVVQIAERYNLPVVTSFLGRNAFPIDHPNNLGCYFGTLSEKEIRDVVEDSDCLLMFGVLLTDTNMVRSLLEKPEGEKIHCVDRGAKLGSKKYENIVLADLFDAILNLSKNESLKGAKDTSIQKKLPHTHEELIRIEKQKKREFKIPSSKKQIKVSQVVDCLNWFLNEVEEMPVVVDTGDVLYASFELHAKEFYGTPFYATMGSAVPSAIGIQISTGKRPLVLVGDGAFQMTGHEISWAPFYKLNPIIVVFNNSAWEMLKGFNSELKQNDIVSWPFETLANAWGGKGYKVTNANHLVESLLDAHKQKFFTIIDVELEKGDITDTLRTFTNQIIKGRK